MLDAGAFWGLVRRGVWKLPWARLEGVLAPAGGGTEAPVVPTASQRLAAPRPPLARDARPSPALWVPVCADPDLRFQGCLLHSIIEVTGRHSLRASVCSPWPGQFPGQNLTPRFLKQSPCTLSPRIGPVGHRMYQHHDCLLSLPCKGGSPARSATQSHVSLWGAGVEVLVVRS